MSLHPQPLSAIPDETQGVAHAAFPKGTHPTTRMRGTAPSATWNGRDIGTPSCDTEARAESRYRPAKHFEGDGRNPRMNCRSFPQECCVAGAGTPSP